MKVGPFVIQRANAVTRKNSRVGGSLFRYFGAGQEQWPSTDQAAYANEGYKKNVVAFRSINLLATAMASIPLYVEDQDTGEKTQDHDLIRLLQNPNISQGGAAFLQESYSWAFITGNFYWEAVQRLGSGDITHLYNLKPHRMTATQGSEGFVSQYVHRAGQEKTYFNIDPRRDRQDPLMHFKLFDPLSDFYGMSPLEAASRGVDIHNMSLGYMNRILRNGGRPGLAFVYKGTETQPFIPADYRDEFRQELQDVFSGEENAGRPLILEGDMDVKDVSFSPQAMEYIENKNTTARDIALALGVPPQLLGIPGDATYSNYKEAKSALYRDTILPFLTMVLESASVFFTPILGEDQRLAYDEDDIIALAPEREAKFERIKNSDYMTINEKREAMGLPPVDGGDVLLIQSSLIPLEEASLDAGGPEPTPEEERLLNPVPDGSSTPPQDTTDEEGEGETDVSINE